MITLEQRLKDYLDSYKFYPNSVDFRIVSSKAIEQFKNVQAFNLNEIRNGKYKFGRTRREVLLLKLDLLSRAIYEIENLCIQFYHNDEKVTPKFINYVIKLIEKSRYVYNEIILDKHPEEFDPVFTEIWLKIINKDNDILLSGIRDLEGSNLIDFFVKLVTLLSSLIQNSTILLYELDTMLRKQSHPYCNTTNGVSKIESESYSSEEKQLMLVISNYLNSNVVRSKEHLRSKLEIYQEHFEIEGIYFKNLSDEPINPGIMSYVEEIGIPIDYKRSLKE